MLIIQETYPDLLIKYMILLEMVIYIHMDYFLIIILRVIIYCLFLYHIYLHTSLRMN
jgi:hypothetical protein